MINKLYSIGTEDIKNSIIFAKMINNDFLLKNKESFDPFDVLQGGSGYPEADPESVALYHAANTFLDEVLTSYEKYRNAIHLNKNEKLLFSWKKEA